MYTYLTRALIILCFFLQGNVSACEITIFECGQGNTILAKYKDEAMVFDAGSSERKNTTGMADLEWYNDSGEQSFAISENKQVGKLNKSIVLNPFVIEAACKGYLKQADKARKDEMNSYLAKSTVKTVWISHPDEDHYNSIVPYNLKSPLYVLGGRLELYDEAFKNFIEKGIVITSNSKKKSTSYYVERYKKKVNANNGQFTVVGSDPAPIVQILSVNAGGNTKEKKFNNQNSMILKLEYMDKSTLLPGDAENKTWDSIDPSDLSSDVLVLSHHGANTHSSTTLSRLKLIKPKIVIISAGVHLKHKHPKYDVIKYLLSYYSEKKIKTKEHVVSFFDGENLKGMITDAPIFTTRDSGRVTINLETLHITTARYYMPSMNDFVVTDDGNYKIDIDNIEGKPILTLAEVKLLYPKKKLIAFNNFEDVYYFRNVYDSPYFYNNGNAYIRVKQIITDLNESSGDGSNSDYASELDEPESSSEDNSDNSDG